MTSLLKIKIYAKTQKGELALLQAIEETELTNSPAKILKLQIPLATKMKKIAQARAIKNQFSMRLISEKPFIVEYCVVVFPNTEGFVYNYHKFREGINVMMEKYGCTQEDYSWQ